MPDDGGRSSSRPVTLTDLRYMARNGLARCIRDPVIGGERSD
jgi:hypothetical protein